MLRSALFVLLVFACDTFVSIEPAGRGQPPHPDPTTDDPELT